MDIIGDFLSNPAIKRQAAATARKIEAFQSASGLSLTPELMRLYRHSNGLSIERLRLRFLSLNEAAAYIKVFRDWDTAAKWAYFPFTDANDSNPHCVSCGERLAGRVVHVFHDDDPLIEFRDFESYLSAVLILLRSDDDPSIDDLVVQFDSDERSTEDVAAGMRLLDLAYPLSKDDPERDQVFHFGMRLLPDENANEILKLLDESESVRKAAFARLRPIPSSEVRTALALFRSTCTQFRVAAVAKLRNAGITVEKEKDDVVLLQPGHIWLNLGAFYEDRNAPDIFDRTVRQAAQVVARKNR